MQTKKRLNYSRLLVVVMTIATMALIGAIIALFLSKPVQPPKPTKAPSIVEQLKQSTVHIRMPASAGSGVFYKKNIIITAKHVCAGAYGMPEAVTVTLYQGLVVYVNSIVEDADPQSDLCLMFTNEDLSTYIPETKIARVLDKNIGMVVYYAGWARGKYFRVLNGIVYSEEIVPLQMRDGTMQTIKLVSVTGFATPGMSGGPVFNSAGEVVGTIIMIDYEVLTTGVSTTEQIRDFLNAQGIE